MQAAAVYIVERSVCAQRRDEQRLAQLMVVDALFTVLASQDYAAIQGTLESSYQICMSHRVDHR